MGEVDVRVSVEEIVSGNLVISLMFRIKRCEPGIDRMMQGMENKKKPVMTTF